MTVALQQSIPPLVTVLLSSPRLIIKAEFRHNRRVSRRNKFKLKLLVELLLSLELLLITKLPRSDTFLPLEKKTSKWSRKTLIARLPHSSKSTFNPACNIVVLVLLSKLVILLTMILSLSR